VKKIRILQNAMQGTRNWQISHNKTCNGGGKKTIRFRTWNIRA